MSMHTLAKQWFPFDAVAVAKEEAAVRSINYTSVFQLELEKEWELKRQRSAQLKPTFCNN